MTIFYTLFVLTLALSRSIGVAASTNDTNLVEQLFLDISADDVTNNTDGIPTVEPWASKYVTTIQEKRFGDAVWARYHMMGEVKNDIVGDTNLTVLGGIKEDAMGYKANAAEQFTEALSLYENTSSEDAHTDVLDVISNVNLQDVSHLEERVTFGIKCSGDHLAYRSCCYRVLDLMSKQKTYLRGRRLVYSINSCNLRVGPQGKGSDVTYYTAHAMALLIEEQCSRVLSCCDSVKVSGYSPRNSGRRKICLSSKSTGCY
ncbi:hypothetical protein EDB81DRAFT_681345 [Dactylonectria macrodidyma]|uniref:WD-like domain-containing protein n=1 Tax=Dactylonectria macrodidyma TaxID=307937 RepID=A0A9P9FNJ1_9HYPO|nr:hypothetical protein EDB81DRAFT_681345 [Dactylonectria macrodidyma]